MKTALLIAAVLAVPVGLVGSACYATGWASAEAGFPAALVVGMVVLQALVTVVSAVLTVALVASVFVIESDFGIVPIALGGFFVFTVNAFVFPDFIGANTQTAAGVFPAAAWLLLSLLLIPLVIVIGALLSDDKPPAVAQPELVAPGL